MTKVKVKAGNTQSTYGQHRHIRSAGIVHMANDLMLWGNLEHGNPNCVCTTPMVRSCASAVEKKDPPNALETASTPPTLQVPAHTTTPPALSIRCRSSVRFGLWSSDRGKAAHHKTNLSRQCIIKTPLQALLLILMHAATDCVCSTTDTAANVTLTSYLNWK